MIKLLKYIKRQLFPDRRSEIGEKMAKLVSASTELSIVDVGAARGLQPHWKVFERMGSLFLIEPNPDEFPELKRLYGYLGSKVHYLQNAVSEMGKKTTLYVTNQTTGSSLLKPDAQELSEYLDQNYIHPIKEVQIETQTLAEVLDSAGAKHNDLMKIDVQGAELQVLKGLGKDRLHKLLALDVEIGMPGSYSGQATLQDVIDLLKPYGLQLFDLRLARIHRPFNNDQEYFHREVFHVVGDSPSIAARICELDAFFVKDINLLVQEKRWSEIQKMLLIFCGYRFFAEAYSAVLKSHKAGLIDATERDRLCSAIKTWHAETRPSWIYGTSKVQKLIRKTLSRLSIKGATRWAQYAEYPYPHG